MPKKRRRQTTAAPTLQTTAGWHWRSFPVFFAFVTGAFLMGLVNGPTNIVGAVFFYIVLFGVAFGAAHFVTRIWAERRLQSRQAAAVRPAEARRPAPAPSAEAGEEGARSPLPESTPAAAPVPGRRHRSRRR